jgi:hypothetical protein
MKTVKLLARSEEDETVELPVELRFDDAEIENFRLFMRNFERFEDADLIQKGMPELKKMGWDAKQGQGLTFEFTDFDYKDVYELLHLARPFFLAKEPASFERTSGILGKRGKGTVLTGTLKLIRTVYDKGEYQSLFQVTLGGTPLFHESTLKAWLNGMEYHQDQDKREQIEKLEAALSQETARGIFVSQLSGRVHAIFELAHIIGLIIRRLDADENAAAKAVR